MAGAFQRRRLYRAAVAVLSRNPAVISYTRERLNEPFPAPWWLRNPHLQTIWGRLARRKRLVEFRREIFETPDDDDLVVDHVEPAGHDARMRVILLHGLEGSSYSVYMQGLAQLFARRGIASSLLNFRYCARQPDNLLQCVPNRRLRLYHSGETTDFDFLLRTLAKRSPGIVFGAVGTSLGGNMMLKWLGENPGTDRLAAAATLSVPYDLAAGGAYLEKSLAGRMYAAHFVRSLIRKAEEMANRFPEVATLLDMQGARKATTFFEFDEAATAPLHGFTGAQDYYDRCSSIHFLARITVPVLCINSRDDPFLPPSELDCAQQVASPAVEFLVSEHGGHVGFVGFGRPRRLRYWAEEAAVEFVAAKLRERLDPR